MKMLLIGMFISLLSVGVSIPADCSESSMLPSYTSNSGIDRYCKGDINCILDQQEYCEQLMQITAVCRIFGGKDAAMQILWECECFDHCGSFNFKCILKCFEKGFGVTLRELEDIIYR